MEKQNICFALHFTSLIYKLQIANGDKLLNFSTTLHAKQKNGTEIKFSLNTRKIKENFILLIPASETT